MKEDLGSCYQNFSDFIEAKVQKKHDLISKNRNKQQNKSNDYNKRINDDNKGKSKEQNEAPTSNQQHTSLVQQPNQQEMENEQQSKLEKMYATFSITKELERLKVPIPLNKHAKNTIN